MLTNTLSDRAMKIIESSGYTQLTIDSIYFYSFKPILDYYLTKGIENYNPELNGQIESMYLEQYGTADSNTAVENAAIRVVALEEEIANDIISFVDVTKEISGIISGISSQEQKTVLEMRYLAFMEWEEVAGRMGYILRHTFYLHRNGLNSVRCTFT